MSEPSRVDPDGNENAKTLLLVEDDRRFADTLASEFRDRGYQVEWVDSLAAVQSRPNLDFRYAVVDLRLRVRRTMKPVQGKE